VLEAAIPLDVLGDRRKHAFPVVGVERFGPCVARRLQRRLLYAVYCNQASVPLDGTGVNVSFEHADVRDIQGQIKSSRHVRQPLLGCLACGYVSIRADQARWRALVVPFDAGAPAFDPDPMAVCVAFPVFENLIVRIAGVLTFNRLHDEVPVVRMDQCDPRLVVAVRFLLRSHAAYGFPCIGIVARTKTKIVVPYAQARAYESVVPTALSLREFSRRRSRSRVQGAGSCGIVF
jgi:hypothetical protein